MFRILALAALPLLSALGLFGNLGSDTEVIATLAALSVLAATANRCSRKRGRPTSIVVFIPICTLLYAVQLGVILYPRLVLAAELLLGLMMAAPSPHSDR